MKSKIYLLLIAFGLLPFFANSQGASLTAMYLDSSQVSICDSTYSINISSNNMDWNSYADANLVFYGSNLINTNFTVVVNWGDNTTTTHTGLCQTDGVAIIWNGPLQHIYTTLGSYVITATLSDPVSGSSISNTFTIQNGVCSQNLISVTSIDCDGDGNIDGTITGQIPMNLVGINNTYIGYPSAWSTYFYSVPIGDYALVVDSAWLSSNGYTVASINPDTVSVTQNGFIPTIQITLNCDSTQYGAQCLNGMTYCDDNNNGIFDSLETVLPNAPITLTLNDGTLQTATSDPNGLYSFNFTGNNFGGTINIDYSWLISNGYYTSLNNIDTVSNLICSNNTILNIPIICDTSNLDSACVNGYVFCDANNDGFMDSTETLLINAPIQLNALGYTITVYSDSNGYYSYTGWQLNTGYVIVSVDQAWLTMNGYSNLTTTTVAIPALNCFNSNSFNIGIDCTSSNTCADLWTTVTPWIGYYQNTTNSVYLSYGNNGQLAPGAYTVTLDYPTGVSPILSTINNPNYTISGNTITWTLTSASTYMYSTDVIYFTTPAGIPDSTIHVFSSTIASTTSDCDYSNNSSTLSMYVGLAYDPNDKSVNQPYYLDVAAQDELTYVVRFQNTGTAPAQDVYILDTLSQLLDLSSLQVVESTHNMQLIDLGNGIIKFDFPQIWLPDSTTNEPASHGHVVFKVKESSSINLEEVIENTAYIYFDQNLPIVTNTTKNVNSVLSIDKSSNIELSLYPNPVNNQLSVIASEKIQLIRIIDLSGKTVIEQTINSNKTTLTLDHLTNGVYAIQVITENGISNKKFIKRIVYF